MARFFYPGRRSGILALLVVCALVIANALFSPPPKAHAADSPDNTPLLLVHGYQDTCTGAFDTQQDATHLDTLTYLEDHGWPSTSLYQVGYYNNDSGCTTSIQGVTTSTGQLACQLLSAGSSKDGTLDDPIQHLGCLLAWYIYDQFTQNGIAVNILAHSMGGLIVRDAIGQTFSNGNLNYDVNFPSQPLLVNRVVTVGTPHGGIGGIYAILAQSNFNSREVADLTVGSNFMTNIIANIQDPQGAGGTFWALMAASDQCSGGAESSLSCADQALNLELGAPGDPWPDGDGIVDAASALAMKADFKVLYGVVETYQNNDVNQLVSYPADSTTQYEHEINACGTLNGAQVCLQPPFYLNDGNNLPSDAQMTKAWTCSSGSSACNSTDLADFQIPTTAPQPVFHSLAEIAWLLAPSIHVVTSHQTFQTPALASFNNRLYVAWTGTQGNLKIMSTADGVNYSSATTIAGVTPNGNPALAAWPDTTLYLAYVDANHHPTLESSTDGVTFGNKQTLSNETTYASSIALAAFTNSKLYIAWTGTDGRLNVEYSTTGRFPTTNKVTLSETSNPSVAPALNGFIETARVYLAWTGTDGRLNADYAPATSPLGFANTWTSSASSQISIWSPALTHVNGRLVLGWTDQNTNLNVLSTDGTTGWMYQDTLADTSSRAPALATILNQLFLAWPATDGTSHLVIAAEY